MDSRLYAIQSRLPEEIISSLEENRGDGNSVWSLLEIYRENNYISVEEETVLYNEYIIPTANHGVHLNSVRPESNNQYGAQTDYGYQNANAQQNYGYQNANAQQNYGYQNANAQPNYGYMNNDAQQYAMQQENRQKAAVIFQQHKKGKRNFVVGVIVAIICLFYGFVFGFINMTDVEIPENLTDNLSSIASGTDYFIKDIVIFGQYAEYYETPETVVEGQEIPEGRKTITDDFYVAMITDDYGTDYLTSVSFKHGSDIAKKLSDFDFDNGAYEMSAYFDTKTFSAFVSDATSENVSIYFDGVIDELNSYADYPLEVIDWNFEYLHPEDYDYEASAESGKMAAIVSMIVFGGIAVGMVILAVSGKKKQKKAAVELARMGYNI